MKRPINGGTLIAGVIGRPVAHSLSPLIHNAWLESAGIDGAYVAISPAVDRFPALLESLRGGSLRGFNVTVPFKEAALAAADEASARARRAGAANLVLFESDGRIVADNTDGVGLMAAFAAQAPSFRFDGAVVAILGAGGAARGAAAAVLEAGASEVRLINRTLPRAEALAVDLGDGVTAVPWDSRKGALAGADALINATLLGQAGQPALEIDLDALAPDAVVMDLVYRPLRTALLLAAEAGGLTPVDGLAMLIGQAGLAFAAFFGAAPPTDVDVRALALTALEEDAR